MGGDESSCFVDLAGRLEAAGETGAMGSNLDRARAAGLDDSSLDALARDAAEANILLDPLTHQFLVRFDTEGADRLGYAPADIDCWVGAIDRSFVAEGSFRPDQIEREPAVGGTVEAADDVVGYLRDRDPTVLLDEERSRRLPAAPTAVLDRLDRQEVVSFNYLVPDEPDAPSVGLGLSWAEGWELVAVWGFDDDAAAADAETALARVLREESRLGALVTADPADVLVRDGQTLWFRAPLREPRNWIRPINEFDPAIAFVLD